VGLLPCLSGLGNGHGAPMAVAALRGDGWGRLRPRSCVVGRDGPIRPRVMLIGTFRVMLIVVLIVLAWCGCYS
jgi:hypothetical protein